MLELHDYQLRAALFLRERRRAALFMDMGLGKTASVLSALGPDDLPALVVGPKMICEVTWPEEIEKWTPGLAHSLIAGSPRKRAEQATKKADIYLAANEVLGDRGVQRLRFKTLIVDEMSAYKNPGSKRAQRVRRLASRPFVENVWGMTGTPAPNGLQDVWGPVSILRPDDNPLAPTYTEYLAQNFQVVRTLPNGVVTKRKIIEGRAPLILRKLEPLALAMKSEDYLELPEFLENVIEVEHPPAMMRKYAEFKEQVRKTRGYGVFDLSEFGGETHSARGEMSVLARMYQLSAGIVYDDDKRGGYDIVSRAKIDAVSRIHSETGDNILVFYWFKAELAMLKKAFPEAVHIKAKGAIQQWKAGKIKMMLAHPGSAGHGLNLQSGGHTAVWLTPPWSAEMWSQANKRLHRNGQIHPVVSHVLCSAGMIDEYVMTALKGKIDVQDAVLEHLKGR